MLTLDVGGVVLLGLGVSQRRDFVCGGARCLLGLAQLATYQSQLGVAGGLRGIRRPPQLGDLGLQCVLSQFSVVELILKAGHLLERLGGRCGGGGVRTRRRRRCRRCGGVRTRSVRLCVRQQSRQLSHARLKIARRGAS